jgi:uncharacterized NAD(P)/FAD-binding protein YdhS
MLDTHSPGLIIAPVASAPAASAAIAIIGGGMSGTLVAIHLLKAIRTPLTIFLIDPTAQWGKGIAYSTPLECHLLNVPAGQISAFPDQSAHFLNWLHHNVNPYITADAFVPRMLYGQYIQSLLHTAEQQSSPYVHLIRIVDQVESLVPSGSGFCLTFRHAVPKYADQVVLALGNLPPATPAIAHSAGFQSDRYLASLWADPNLNSIAADDEVLLIGTGLTAIDGVMTLCHRHHRGRIHLVSRRGFLPQVHQPFPLYPLTFPQPVPTRLRQWVHWLRQEIAGAEAQGYDWRSLIDSLRPLTTQIWQSLSLADQRRFLRHVRPYWDSHRHRMAPAIAQTLTRLKTTGQLHLHAGRIQLIDEDEPAITVVLRSRDSQTLQTLRVQRVINCTSPANFGATCSNPLIVSLLETGVVYSDRLNLGIAVAANGAVIGRNGIPATNLYTLGNPMKGTLWETTAIAEIRQQAKSIAKAIQHQLLQSCTAYDTVNP